MTLFCMQCMLGCVGEYERSSGLHVIGKIVAVDLLSETETKPVRLQYTLELEEGHRIKTRAVPIIPGAVAVPQHIPLVQPSIP